MTDLSQVKQTITPSHFANTSYHLAGRLPLLQVKDLTETQRSLYQVLSAAKREEAAKSGYQAVASDGTLLGPFNSYLYIPEISLGYDAWIEAQHKHSPFEAEVREAVILTVGRIWAAEYLIYAHAAAAQTAGIRASTIDHLIDGSEVPELSFRARIAIQFTSSLILKHEVEDSLYSETKRIFGDSGVVALTHLIGLYLSVSAVLRVFRVPSQGLPLPQQ